MRQISIKTKFLVMMVVFMFSFILLITNLWNSKVSKNAETTSLSYMNELTQISTNNFEVSLRDIDHIIVMLSSNQEIVAEALSADYTSEKAQLEDSRRVEGLLVNELNFKRYLSSIMLASRDGRYYTVGESLRLETLRKQPWYESIYDSGGEKLIVGPYSYANKTVTIPDTSKNQDVIISIIRPIKKDSAVIGFAKADIKFDMLLDLFNLNLKDNASVMIVDQDGNPVLKPAVDLAPSASGELLAKATADSGEFEYRINGKEYSVSYYRSSFTNWTTFGLISKDKVLEGFKETRRKVTVLTLAISLAALGILYLLISLLTRNLLLLSKAMKSSFSNNHSPISIKIKGKDEVGLLYHQFNQMISRIRELLHHTKLNEEEKRKAEMKALQAQINPHFLHNTLNTIKFLADLQGSAGIRDVSESLSTLMRINMDRREFITVEEEIRYLESYLNIQSYKYTNKFTANISVEPGLESAFILKLLLQPIVENALIHGIAPMKGQGKLSVKVMKANTHLLIRIEDNGVGMVGDTILRLTDEAQPADRIGLRNVIDRLKLHFDSAGRLKVVSEAGYYTIVEIAHPLLTEPEVKTS